ncbi:MAG: glycosyltransferase family 2 protein [Acidobacteriaceae bacterium]
MTTPATSPQVSVVIPTRGRPELVLRAVRSALVQTLVPHEVIVVVDGPDPATCQALSSLPDRRVRVIALETPVGGAEARNVGARAASGDWIALLDDDDAWLPAKLSRQLDAAARESEANLVVCQHFLRSDDAEDTVRPRRLPRAGESIPDFMFDYLCYFQTSSFVVKRWLFLEVPFPTGQAFFQDIDWFLRVNQRPETRLAIVAEPLAIYYEPRRRATITSKTSWKARLDWGKANRHRMSRKAYSRFVVGSCAARAVEEGAGLSGLVLLFRECVVSGSASLTQLILLGGISVLSPRQRRVWRDRLFLRRKSMSPMSAVPEKI